MQKLKACYLFLDFSWCLVILSTIPSLKLLSHLASTFILMYHVITMSIKVLGHTLFFFFGEENFYSTTTQEDTKLWTLRYTYHVYRVSFNIDIYCPNYVFAVIIRLNITYFTKNWKLKTKKKKKNFGYCS